jgi:hypothetical protein
MPDQKLLSLTRDARARAEEILTRAETFHDPEAKQRMLELAVKYQKLAERLEQAAERGPAASAAEGAAIKAVSQKH